jgi:hypothetical protein
MDVPQKQGLRHRLAPSVERLERFLKDFEWTWTKAVIFCLGFTFFILISMVIIPSWFMYWAETSLGWKGPSGGGDWQTPLRDAIAMGLTTGPLITVWIAASWLQNYRRRLRGRTGDTRPSGGYR